MIAKRAKARSPDIFDWGFAVGEEVGVVTEEWQRSTGAKDDADEFSYVDGINQLMPRVKAKQ